MKTSQKILIIAVPVVILGLFMALRPKSEDVPLQTLVIEEAPFEVTISSTASVLPENRILITPPSRGRVDKVLVKEGDSVKSGQILGWMSSQDRVALIDAARSGGPKEVAKWENIYKQSPLYAPTSGKIIRQNLVEGQTVNPTDTLFEISDRLVVVAQVDESDIRQINVGQKANIRLDAFPDQTFVAEVSRISQQSQVISGVNLFQVTLIPQSDVAELKSGLTAATYFVVHSTENAKLVPSWVAGGKENSKAELFIKSADGKTAMRAVQFGRSNGEKVEILSDLASSDQILFRPLNLQTPSKGLNFLNRKQK